MSFNGFTKSDFETFNIDGLDARMQAIRERIQPKFQVLGEIVRDELALLTGKEMFLHIAKHARRKINPPKDTWLAVSDNKRGYKQHPHFQVGLFDDHVFIWFALIYELPAKQAIAVKYLKQGGKLKKIIPNDYLLSFDHTQKKAVRAGDISQKAWKAELERFRDIKKTELLIGQHLSANDPLLQNGEEFISFVKNTFETLLPLYKIATE